MPNADFDAVSVEEYLDATYEPDCEFIDGRLLQRPEVSQRQKFLEKRLLAYFGEFEDPCNVRTLAHQRICILDTKRAQRYRIADICLARRPHERARILRQPPLLTVEVLRPYEPAGTVLARLSDFQRIGVKHIWAVDADEAQWYVLNDRGLHQVPGHQLAIPELSLTLSLRPFFQELG